MLSVERIRVSDRCDHDCPFCRKMNAKSSHTKSFEEIKAELLLCKKKGIHEVFFPCNLEFRTDVDEIIALAKFLGFRVVLETCSRELTGALHMVDEIVVYGKRDMIRNEITIPQVSKRVPITRRDTQQLTKIVQMIVSYGCNRSCSYCYSSKLIGQYADMKKADFINALFWLKRENIGSFNFIGGEPTLHPEIGMFVGIAKNMGFRCHFFTNGLFPEGRIEKIMRGDSFTINYQEKAAYNDEESALLDKNIRALRSLGKEIVLAYTIDERVKRYDHIIEACKEHDIRTVQVNMVTPDSYKSNRFMEDGRFKDVKVFFLESIRALQSEGIKTRTSRPLPRCFFSEDELKRHSLNTKGCGPGRSIIAINPDLSVFPCLQLFFRGPRLPSIAGMEAYESFYQATIERLKWGVGFFPECASCSYFQKKECQGACLCFKLQGFTCTENPRVRMFSQFAEEETEPLRRAIDEGMARLDATFGRLKRRPNIFIFRTKSDFNDYAGGYRNPSWVGGFVDGSVFSYYQLGPGIGPHLVHELCHLYLHYHASFPLPAWFAEGICDYLNWKDHNPAFRVLLKTTRMYSFEELRSVNNLLALDAGRPMENMAKRQVHALMVFFVERFGLDRITSIFRKEGSFEQRFREVLGRTPEEAYGEFMEKI